MTMDHESRAPAKRPYTTPVLTAHDLFGAEAATGSCCRATTGTCSLATRTTLRLSIDGAKNQTSSNS
jgi:hypothetical protein